MLKTSSQADLITRMFPWSLKSTSNLTNITSKILETFDQGKSWYQGKGVFSLKLSYSKISYDNHVLLTAAKSSKFFFCITAK